MLWVFSPAVTGAHRLWVHLYTCPNKPLYCTALRLRVSVLWICSFTGLLIAGCVQRDVHLLSTLYVLCMCVYTSVARWRCQEGGYHVSLLYRKSKLTEKVALKGKNEAVIPLKLLPTIKITQQSASALASFSHDVKPGLTVPRVLWATSTSLLILLILEAGALSSHKPYTKWRFLV